MVSTKKRREEQSGDRYAFRPGGLGAAECSSCMAVTLNHGPMRASNDDCREGLHSPKDSEAAECAVGVGLRGCRIRVAATALDTRAQKPTQRTAPDGRGSENTVAAQKTRRGSGTTRRTAPHGRAQKPVAARKQRHGSEAGTRTNVVCQSKMATRPGVDTSVDRQAECLRHD